MSRVTGNHFKWKDDLLPEIFAFAFNAGTDIHVTSVEILSIFSQKTWMPS